MAKPDQEPKIPVMYRIPRGLHADIQSLARESGRSLNQTMVDLHAECRRAGLTGIPEPEPKEEIPQEGENSGVGIGLTTGG
jgi:hypothetical protein